ncbi:putative regulator of Vps4 activity in the MVB pathway [Lyophyllum shimeji]|uniref:Regulator of Vps4 activity in the MVB pathway n=1 Tax=Lyophyllum shimeji TaxID=47721 RepID=A0A9P3PGZ7_LYOSH|nr:putative regulator of Vps4 activity in the MVB pathway [Lyophyllum shimeji]
MPPWNASKAKIQLRLSVQRLKTLQQKKDAQAKSTRRDIATLLERGKVETARVKVEALIHEDIHVELLELLELYCELLLARFGLLDQNTREPDIGVKESVCSIIHAAPRTELKELHVLRDILMHKYGREFSIAVMENRDSCVSDRVMRKIDIATPSPELVDAYLYEIAKGYSIEWTPPNHKDSDSAEGGAKDSGSDADRKPADSLTGNTSELRPQASGTPPIDGDLQESKDLPAKPPPYTSAKPSKSSSASPEPAEDEFDVLAKRFAALKKR